MERLTFLGVRGSYPTVYRDFLKYGGNTASVMIEQAGDLIFLDAGTGIIRAGATILQKKETQNIHIFLSHLHLDHIQGLPYFAPLFYADYRIKIYVPAAHLQKAGSFLLKFFNPPIHPVQTAGLKAEVQIVELAEDAAGPVNLPGGSRIRYVKDHSHPTLGVLIYIVEGKRHRIVYATDVEASRGLPEEVFSLGESCDILIHDAQYCEEHANGDDPYVNLGHSSVKMAISSARQLRAKNLYLFHYGPTYNDHSLDDIGRTLQREGKGYFLSAEGKKINLRR